MELQEAADRLSILDRYAAYAHAIDTNQGDAFVDCFTADGWMDISGFETTERLADAGLLTFADEQGVVRGEENLRTSVEVVNSVLGLHHLIGNVLIRSIEGDRARTSAYFVVFASDDGRVEHYGRYEDELMRCEDGEWRFASHVDGALYERDRELPPAAHA